MSNRYYKCLMISKLILLFYSTLTIIGCSKEKDRSQQSSYEEKAPQSTGSTIAETPQLSYRSVNKPETVRGVVYVSNIDSSSHLALESESGTVYLIVGEKKWELSNLQNRKVEVWGYLRKNVNGQGTRDSIEVVRYQVIHGEGD
ncbi:MAG: hypothetical protein ACE5NG_10325 [bacterium]